MEAKNKVDKNSIQALVQRKNAGRSLLMTVLCLTAVNLLFLLLDMDRYFLFAISLPYYLAAIPRAFGESTGGPAAISLLILGGYLLLYLLSKKKHGLIMTAAVLLTIDTVLLIAISFIFMESPWSNLADLIILIGVDIAMYSSANADRKLRRMEQDNPYSEEVIRTGAAEILQTTDPEKF